jgi:cell division protein ZapE
VSDSAAQPDAHSPLQRYQRILADTAADGGTFHADVGQEQVVQRLDELFQQLMQQPKQSLWQKWITRSAPQPVEGLYIWGTVGRGKTLLMDMFFDCLPAGRAQRMHFHRFMRHVHLGLKTHGGVADPLQRVADEFAHQTSILCFDEFFVSDIGDAMILAELMRALFARGVTLVATSNVEPRGLYENGLQRSRFLPAIDLLYQHCAVVEIEQGQDFRLRTLAQAEIYHYPSDAGAEESLQGSFIALAAAPIEQAVPLLIEGRSINTRKLSQGIVWFDFADLCEGPRSQNDYIELATLYHTVFVSNIPILDTRKEDAARRFISW